MINPLNYKTNIFKCFWRQELNQIIQNKFPASSHDSSSYFSGFTELAYLVKQ